MSAYFEKCKELQAQLVADLNILLENKDRIDTYDAFAKEHGFKLLICPHNHTGDLSIIAIAKFGEIPDNAIALDEKFNNKQAYSVNGFEVICL